MSYILDALRRADAERDRDRGAVPGLHSMPVGGTATAATARSRRALWLGGAALLFALLSALLLGGWRWRTTTVPATAQVPGQAAPVVSSPLPPAAQLATEPTPAPGPAVASARAPSPSPSPSPALPSAGATAAAPRPLARPPRAQAPTATPKVAGPSAAASAPSAAAPLRASDTVPAFEQLPDEVKRSIPPLAVSGAVYSDNPASRLLMIGGQLLKEGDSAGSGVTLEQIRPRSAVLRWRDVRYEVKY